MLAYTIHESENPAAAWVETELAKPEAGPGQICIKVKAVSLNYRDLVLARGAYGSPVKEHCIPTSDGAGEVVAIGEGVTHIKPGDRVVAGFSQSWLDGPILESYIGAELGGALDGMLAQYVVLDETVVAKIPDSISYEEAATLPCAGVTAWHALMSGSQPLKAGGTVLTLGSGGVSSFVIKLAKSAGCRVIATTGNADKAQKLYELGADEVINYRDFPQWEEEVMKVTDGVGVDQVIELGGAATLSHSLAATRMGGRVSLIGVLGGPNYEFNPMQIMHKHACIEGIMVGSLSMLKELMAYMDEKHILPEIDAVYDFEQAPVALVELGKQSHFGKLVVRV